MAKATAKKRKVIVESTEKLIFQALNNIIISLTNKKGEVISWSLENGF
jgi:ribosomal protein S11